MIILKGICQQHVHARKDKGFQKSKDDMLNSYRMCETQEDVKNINKYGDFIFIDNNQGLILTEKL